MVGHRETGRKYVKKLLTIYNRSVYDYLKDNPVKHMPTIHEIYESENCLIVIEECIEGKTIADLLEDNAFSEDRAIDIAIDICRILEIIHGLPTPIIHREPAREPLPMPRFFKAPPKPAASWPLK